jgi:hypothetical protein
MLLINPALVIGVGDCADEIVKRTKELILEHCGLESLPPIFQFILLREDSDDAIEQALNAFFVAKSALASSEAERTSHFRVDNSSMQVFVIFPLQAQPLNVALETLKKLRTQTDSVIAGSVNAIALAARRLLSLDRESFRVAAHTLDSSMKAPGATSPFLPFNRCYFIDEYNETGQMLSASEEVVELVSRFIALSTASALSPALKKSPSPYIGDGPHYQAYASFCSNRIGFSCNSLIQALSADLAAEISQKLFQADNSFSGSDRLLGRASHWFEESINKSTGGKKKVAGHVVATPDTQQVPAEFDPETIEKDFMDFTMELCASSRSDMRGLQRLLERCMHEGMKRLEELHSEMATIKKRISELLIMIMLKIPCGESTSHTYREEVVRPTGWMIACLMAGVLAIIGAAFAQGDDLPAMLGGGGGFLLLLAFILYIFGKNTKRLPIPVTNPISCEAELERRRAEFELKMKVFSQHIALFTRLDLAYANVETLRSMPAAYEFRPPEGILDFDLFDERLVARLYSDYSQSKETDADGFISPADIKEFHNSLLSFPTITLSDVLLEYCRSCFSHLASYNLKQIWQVRASLSGNKDSLTFLSPFWHPFSASKGEKTLIALLGQSSHQDMRPLLQNLFRANSIHMTDGPNENEIIVVQISYGLKLEDFFIFAQHAN